MLTQFGNLENKPFWFSPGSWKYWIPSHFEDPGCWKYWISSHFEDPESGQLDLKPFQEPCIPDILDFTPFQERWILAILDLKPFQEPWILEILDLKPFQEPERRTWCLYIEVRDCRTGSLIPARYGLGVWPDGKIVGVWLSSLSASLGGSGWHSAQETIFRPFPMVWDS